MTQETSVRLGLPLIAAGQAQKHVTHNESLTILDAMVQLSVVSISATPIASPTANACYIVGASPTGVWVGHAHDIAVYQDSAWVYYTPAVGWRSFVQDQNALFVFTGSAWVNYNSLLGALANIPHLGVNTTANTTTRFIAKSDASLFDQVSGSVRVNVNKATSTDTASYIFQNGYSGRAEFGLLGSDNFEVKVSSNGSSWTSAMQVASTGKVSFPAGVNIAQAGGFERCTSDKTIRVPEDYATIQAALDAMLGYYFVGSARGIIQLSDGDHTISSSLYNYHPQWFKISLEAYSAATQPVAADIVSSKTTTKDNLRAKYPCRIIVSGGFTGIYCGSQVDTIGGGFGFIKNILFQGIGSSGSTGIRLAAGGVLSLWRCAFIDFQNGITLNVGGRLNAANYTGGNWLCVVHNSADGIVCDRSASTVLYSALIARNNRGIYVGNAGAVIGSVSEICDNTQSGVAAYNRAYVSLTTTTLKNHAGSQYAIELYGGAMVELATVTFDTNATGSLMISEGAVGKITGLTFAAGSTSAHRTITANRGSFIQDYGGHSVSPTYSPSLNAIGNNNSYISNV